MQAFCTAYTLMRESKHWKSVKASTLMFVEVNAAEGKHDICIVSWKSFSVRNSTR